MKKKGILPILMVFLVVLILGGWYAWQSGWISPSIQPPQPPIPTCDPTKIISESWSGCSAWSPASGSLKQKTKTNECGVSEITETITCGCLARQATSSQLWMRCNNNGWSCYMQQYQCPEKILIGGKEYGVFNCAVTEQGCSGGNSFSPRQISSVCPNPAIYCSQCLTQQGYYASDAISYYECS